MSKLIRRKKEIGAALAVALQLTTLTLIGVIGQFAAGPQHSTKAPAASQTTAAPQDQTQTSPAQSSTDLSYLRTTAVFANKISGPRAAQIFDLAASRAAAAPKAQQSGQRSSQEGGELPNDGPTLTTNQDDYPPYSYVYFHGTGFQPGETVNMIVVELDPVQASFEPWDVVADENGEFDTSWYIFSTDFIGATLQATATGQSSQLTASATFTDSVVSATITTVNGIPAANFGPPVNANITYTSLPQSVTVAFTYATSASGTTTGELNLVGSAVTTGPQTIPTSPTNGALLSTSLTLTIPSGTANGTYNLNVTVTNTSGSGTNQKSDHVNQAIVINVPTNNPPVARCRNVSVSAGANCTAPASIDNGSSDPDPGDSITLSQSPAGPYQLGNTAVTLTVTDSHGASNSCNATVTVVDDTPPTVSCKPATVNLDANGNASISESDVVLSKSDNCGTPTITLSQTAFTCANIGPNTVHVTADDGHGNHASCDATVTVVDNTQPTVSCKNATVYLDANGHASIAESNVVASKSDNCGTPTITLSKSTFTCADIGTNTVHVTADDDHNNTASCDATVTVVDNTAPVIHNCPSDITVSTGVGATSCSAPASWAAPTASDNCHVASLTPDHASGSSFPVGNTTVTYTATDDAGNTSTCSFNVHVVDNTAPVITGCPSDITVSTGVGATSCSAPASWAAPTASDNCHVASLTPDHASGSSFPVGNTTVTYTATDDAGNTSTCSFNVHVVDNTVPVITGCPSDITVYTGVGATACSAPASWTAPTASDNCHVATFTPDHASGSSFPVGTTAVTYTATDDAGNQSTCSFNVHVIDNTPPVITQCAADQNITAACAGSTLVPDFTAGVTATDNCSGALTITQTPAAGTAVAVGDTTVTLHVKDAANNEATCAAHLIVNYNWSGFFQPVDNIPTFNRVKAGSAIPVKFSLGCNEGLNILAAGFPQSGLVACDNHEPVDDVETTVNAGGSSLNYDAASNQYIYVWKTDKAWGGTCRVLNVRLADGTSHYAYFNFTR